MGDYNGIEDGLLDRSKNKTKRLPFFTRRRSRLVAIKSRLMRIFHGLKNSFSSLRRYFLLILFFLIMLFIGRSLFSNPQNLLPSNQTIDHNSRLDCHLELGLTKEKCLSRNCLYDDSLEGKNTSIPICYYPPNVGYTLHSSSRNVLLLKKPIDGFKNPNGEDFKELILTYKEIGAGLHVSIYPSGPSRYRPPIAINEKPDLDSSEKLGFEIKYGSIFSFSIVRKSDGAKLWDTSIGGLLYANQFLQISTFLPSDNIYGFGEQIHTNIKHDLKEYKTWAMFSRDEKTEWAYATGRNLYGVHPFYLIIEKSGKAHGVFFFNSNAQEVTLGPAPHLTYRTIGGQLEFFYFPGPTPEEVIQQYQQVIGKPMLPAYWALGYQLSQWGYKELNNMKAAVKRTQDAAIPLDVITADIDYMYHNEDFSYDYKSWKDLPRYAKELKKQGLHLNLIMDPGIEPTKKSWIEAQKMGVSFIEWPNFELVQKSIQNKYPLANETKVMFGAAWPDNHIAWPDFFDSTGKTQAWWMAQLEKFQKMIPYNSIWLDLNEPSAFSTNEDDPWYLHKPEYFPVPHNLEPLMCPLQGKYAYLEDPPYPTTAVIWWDKDKPFETPKKNYLSTKTVCMVGTVNHGQYTMYDTHNLYGLMESITSYQGLKKATGKRGVVVARSTFPSSGKYVGHWLGDNTADWRDLKSSIIGVMEFNMFGIPYVGADICGFNNATTEKLCLRWHQLGAFYSFSRNHNDGYHQPPQDPAQWPKVAQATRKSYIFRYRHLPYLYSLHFKVHFHGGTIFKPLFFEFPKDKTTYNISEQFLWGPAILVVPVADPGKDGVGGYLPEGEKWYSLYDWEYGRKMPPGYHKFKAPLDYLPPIFVRGSRSKDGVATAKGDIYWDDGESIIDDIHSYNYHHLEFEFLLNKAIAELKIYQRRKAKDLPLPPLENIEIFGYTYLPMFQTASLNDKEYVIDSPDTYYDAKKSLVNVTKVELIDLNNGGPVWTLKWQNTGIEQEDNLLNLL